MVNIKMKSKFIGKLIFTSLLEYNPKGKNHYIVIFELKEEYHYGFDKVWINGIDLNGQTVHFLRSKKWMYKNLEIIDAKHLHKEFIANIFRNN